MNIFLLKHKQVLTFKVAFSVCLPDTETSSGFHQSVCEPCYECLDGFSALISLPGNQHCFLDRLP